MTSLGKEESMKLGSCHDNKAVHDGDLNYQSREFTTLGKVSRKLEGEEAQTTEDVLLE